MSDDRLGTGDIEARLRELVGVANGLLEAAEARGCDVVALRDVLAVGGKDRVVVDQAVDLLRNLGGMRRRAVWLLDVLQGIGTAGLLQRSPDLTAPAKALVLALSAAEHALAPLAAADGRSHVALIGGVSIGLVGRFVPVVEGSAREVLQLLGLTLGSVTSRPGMRHPRWLRAVPAGPP